MLVCIAGVFGERMADVAGRADGRPSADGIEVPWGQVFSGERVATALREKGPFKVVGIVHAETSTGAAQPIAPISEVVHQAGALFLVDTVTSLGGMQVDVDGWQIDPSADGLQRHAEVPVLPSRAFARRRLRPAGGLAPVIRQLTDRELVPGHEHGPQWLEHVFQPRRAAVPPHRPSVS